LHRLNAAEREPPLQGTILEGDLEEAEEEEEDTIEILAVAMRRTLIITVVGMVVMHIMITATATGTTDTMTEIGTEIGMMREIDRRIGEITTVTEIDRRDVTAHVIE